MAVIRKYAKHGPNAGGGGSESGDNHHAAVSRTVITATINGDNLTELMNHITQECEVISERMAGHLKDVKLEVCLQLHFIYERVSY